MKITLLKSLLIILLITLSALITQAQQRGSPSVAPRTAKSKIKYRLMANYDLAMTNPSALNDYRSVAKWSGTTVTEGTFNNMNGFSVGAGYLLNSGFIGLEYSHSFQDLPNTYVPPGTFRVQDTFNYDTVYLTYDWLINPAIELGAGIGQTLKFQYHNILTSGSVTEDVIWQATPMVFKVRAAYNFHMSSTFKFRIGASYESAASSSVQADSNHPTVGTGITSGQSLKGADGSDVKVDISGLHLNAGLVVAF